uniref:Uncharacterized protein n=1 Tax=Mycobacterium sp. (strain JLS) TaxID=164757 RepID=A0A5Q5CHK6_MYCSJ
MRGGRAGRAERRRSEPVLNPQRTAHLHEYPPDRPVTTRGIVSLATDSRATTVGLAARCGCVGRFGANPRGPPIGGRIFSSGSQVAPASAILRAAEGKSGIPEIDDCGESSRRRVRPHWSATTPAIGRDCWPPPRCTSWQVMRILRS